MILAAVAIVLVDIQLVATSGTSLVAILMTGAAGGLGGGGLNLLVRPSGRRRR